VFAGLGLPSLLMILGLLNAPAPTGDRAPSMQGVSAGPDGGKTASTRPLAEPGVQLWKEVEGARREVGRLEAAPGILNPVLSLLATLVDEDLHGRVSQLRLRREVEDRGDRRIPWQYFLWIRRDPDRRLGHPVITVRFLSDQAVPVPYAILGYHPGRLRTSSKVVLDEWPMGNQVIQWDDSEGSHRFVAEDLELFALREGRVQIDIDGVVDWILGGRLDDIEITGMAYFSHEGERYGLAFGYNPDGKGRTGVLDLGRDRILFPPARPFLMLGRRMRSIAEAWQRREARIPERAPAGG